MLLDSFERIVEQAKEFLQDVLFDESEYWNMFVGEIHEIQSVSYKAPKSKYYEVVSVLNYEEIEMNVQFECYSRRMALNGNMLRN